MQISASVAKGVAMDVAEPINHVHGSEWWLIIHKMFPEHMINHVEQQAQTF